MTENADRVTESSAVPERMARVLDAAAELLARWGYRRVTIEDVAAEAGIGKGTVYLHFRTKDALFLTVLLRTYRGMTTHLTGLMRADPREVLPGRLIRSSYLMLLDHPVARRLYLGDVEMLGRLAREAIGTLGELRVRSSAASRVHLELLREAGLVRTDIEINAQQYLFDAIGAGFFFVDSLGLPHAPADAAARADLMAYGMANALEVPGAPDPDAALAARIAGEYDALLDFIDDEWQRRAR